MLFRKQSFGSIGLAAALTMLLLNTGCMLKGESPELVLRSSEAESTEVVRLNPVYLSQQQDAGTNVAGSESSAVTRPQPLMAAVEPLASDDETQLAQSDILDTENLSPTKAGNATNFDGISLIWPTTVGKISSPFGMRRGRLHAGIDISAPKGTPVRASAAGQVLLSRYKGAYGNMIIIGHDGDRQTVYAHLNAFNASEGDLVKSGDVIGYVGRTGRATGNHLHFETRVGGVPMDPMTFLPPQPSSQISWLTEIQKFLAFSE